MRPILVTGSNRSGTTWTGKMLSLAKEVFFVWEPFNCEDPLPFHKHPLSIHYKRLLPEESRAVRKFVDRKTLFEIVNSTEGGNSGRAKIIKLKESFRKAVGYAMGTKVPLFKDPTALMSAEWFEQVYNARIVMIVRHPAAYVNSIKRLNWPTSLEGLASQPNLMNTLPEYLQEEIHQRIFLRKKPKCFTLEDASLSWKVFNQVIYQYSKHHPNWILVKHEELSLNYVRSFRTLFESLCLTWTSEIEKKVEYLCNPMNEVTQGDVTHHLKQNSAALTKLWKSSLTEDEQVTIRRITEPVSSLFYDDSSWD